MDELVRKKKQFVHPCGGGVLVSVSEKNKKKKTFFKTVQVLCMTSAGANPHLSHNQQMSFSGSISKHLTKNKQKQIPLRTMFKK